MENRGYFLFSLDTELATGYFDKDDVRTDLFSRDGVKERNMISRLLDMLNEYRIQATWAIVGHLFYQNCEYCDLCPIKEWQGKFSSYDEAYGTDHPLWYGADVVDLILEKGAHHEIGFHGYTHELFNERYMSKEKARFEIHEWLRLASRKNIVPTSVVFPRDWGGHYSLFKEAGFTNFRGEEFQPLIIRNKYFGRYVKTLDHILSVTTPPVYSLDQIDSVDGLVNLPESQHIFGFNRKVDLFLDARNLQLLRIQRILKGIKKAAREKKIIHIWAHPWEFQTEKDFERLQAIFTTVRQEIDKKTMCSVTMNDMAKRILQRQSQH